jgi:hypothetical protein
MEQIVSAADNPELAQELVRKAISDPDRDEGRQLVETPSVNTLGEKDIVPPPSGEVELLAGLYNSFTGELTTTAEVRELTGADEEAISKIADYGRSLLTVLERGTVRIGEEPATKALLDKLLAGDRDYLLMKIRIATFGKELELSGNCPSCEAFQEITLDLEKDVVLTRLENPTSDRTLIVDCRIGQVMVEFPNGIVQRKLVESKDKSPAELDTQLLAQCVVQINENPAVTEAHIRALGIQDRRTLLKAISDKNPGPELDTIVKACTACGQEVPTPLTLSDIFRL